MAANELEGDSKFNKDLLFSFFGFAILAVSGILINLVIAVSRGSEALGVFNQVFALHLIISQLSVAGLQFSTLKQISQQQDNYSGAFSSLASALVLVTPLSVLVTSLIYFLAPNIGAILRSEAVEYGIYYLLPGLFLFPINKVLLMSLNGMRHMRAYSCFNAGRYVVILITLSTLLALDAETPTLLLSLAITEIVLFFFFTGYIFFVLFRNALCMPSRDKVSEHCSFGIRASFSGLLIELNTRVDILMLGLFSSDGLVGIYSFAATLAEGFKQLPSILRWNVDPILGDLFAKKRFDEIKQLVKETQRKYLPFFWAFCMISVLVYPIGLNIINVATSFSDSWLVFSILVTAVAISALYTPFNGIILQGGRPGLQSFITLATVLFNITANLILIPIFGVFGAAIATAITFILDALLIAYVSKRIFNISL